MKYGLKDPYNWFKGLNRHKPTKYASTFCAALAYPMTNAI
jgi:hypothetical protein